ncbi:p-loop containing nucleoside triphosphate hydrolase-4 [Coleophoma crateriformis]|uniref:p-loop containing nucleoside triphosphate hydrolase-4 n=1 Tax=Coleophoma crateriformis TaxID=565419 RepID=A0A3D8QQ74_9HELO|nr:p-loop containing nucleoside triphosphate hydrolase-4 [Coleophoma crateriformis]
MTITICGDGGCGKSSITLRLVRSQWTHEYDPTIEDSYTLSRQIDGQTYHLSLTDTAGQEEYRGMWAASNLRSDAFLLVYDITSSSSLQELEYFNNLIDMEAETREEAWRSDPANRGRGFVKPIKIVAGNKCDLQESRQVSARTGLEWARKRQCGFMETSARNVVNIEETFALIVRRVAEARRVAEMGERGRDRLTIISESHGTRRAPTAPLSPLPVLREKDEAPIKKNGALYRTFRKLSCLRCW